MTAIAEKNCTNSRSAWRDCLTAALPRATSKSQLCSDQLGARTGLTGACPAFEGRA